MTRAAARRRSCRWQRCVSDLTNRSPLDLSSDLGTPVSLLDRDREALCIEKGMRMTEQRRVIARVLSQSDDHPDVEELHRRAHAIDRHISIATVYRTVRLFEDAGMIDRHDFRDGRARYEEARRSQRPPPSTTSPHRQGGRVRRRRDRGGSHCRPGRRPARRRGRRSFRRSMRQLPDLIARIGRGEPRTGRWIFSGVHTPIIEPASRPQKVLAPQFVTP